MELHAVIINKDLKLTKAKKIAKDIINNDKRIYACGCGKSYLSYPALYTHLK